MKRYVYITDFSLLHKFSSAYIRITDRVYMYVFSLPQKNNNNIANKNRNIYASLNQ